MRVLDILILALGVAEPIGFYYCCSQWDCGLIHVSGTTWNWHYINLGSFDTRVFWNLGLGGFDCWHFLLVLRGIVHKHWVVVELVLHCTVQHTVIIDWYVMSVSYDWWGVTWALFVSYSHGNFVLILNLGLSSWSVCVIEVNLSKRFLGSSLNTCLMWAATTATLFLIDNLLWVTFIKILTNCLSILTLIINLIYNSLSLIFHSSRWLLLNSLNLITFLNSSPIFFNSFLVNISLNSIKRILITYIDSSLLLSSWSVHQYLFLRPFNT